MTVFREGIIISVLAGLVLSAFGAPLKEIFKNDFLVGNVMGSGHKYSAMRNDTEELKVLVREFNCLTAENLMKSEYLQPKPGEFHFKVTDRFVDFSEKHNMEVVGHALVWHSQTPDWLFKDGAGKPVSREVLIERMRVHIHTVVGRYKGRIKYWDVINEAVRTKMVVDESLPLDEEGNPQKRRVAFFRDSPWRQIIGDDYIELAFRFAHEADPEALLLYNDYSMTQKAKAEFVAEMIRGLQEKGVPVHGVGMQGHWHLEYPSIEELQTAIGIYAGAGLKVSVTELDVGILPRARKQQGADIGENVEQQIELNPYTNGVPLEALAKQAATYRAIFRVLLDNKEVVERVTIWGISDRDTWRNDWPIKGRTAHPLLFDRNFQPKPNYYALKELAAEE